MNELNKEAFFNEKFLCVFAIPHSMNHELYVKFKKTPTHIRKVFIHGSFEAAMVSSNASLEEDDHIKQQARKILSTSPAEIDDSWP